MNDGLHGLDLRCEPVDGWQNASNESARQAEKDGNTPSVEKIICEGLPVAGVGLVSWASEMCRRPWPCDCRPVIQGVA